MYCRAILPYCMRANYKQPYEEESEGRTPGVSGLYGVTSKFQLRTRINFSSQLWILFPMLLVSISPNSCCASLGLLPRTRTELKRAVDGCLKLSPQCACSHVPHGPIGAWDVSRVTDMSRMFSSARLFQGDISKWDVSKVRNMYGMFSHATAFNGNILRWDVSSVSFMDYMFSHTTSFNRKLCGASWVHSKATKVGMFEASPGSISTTVCSINPASKLTFAPQSRAELQSAVRACSGQACTAEDGPGKGKAIAKLKLYGVPLSQPCRAVMWALNWKNVDYDFVSTMPHSAKKGGARHPDYLSICPTGQIPAINDDGFVLEEASAILIYLAEKNGWTDLYPSDPKQRAMIHQWLSFTVCSLRKLTSGLFAPIFVKGLSPNPGDIDLATKAVTVAENQLGKTDWLAGGDGPSLADIAAYQEVSQCQEKFVDVFDFGPFPNIRAWMARCEEQPQWAETHLEPMALGLKMKKFFLSKTKSKS